MCQRPVVLVGGLDDAVPVEPKLLAIVLAHVRVVPVDAGIREGDAGRVAAAWRDRLLRLVGPVVAVLKAQAVPVHSVRDVAVVVDVDDDLRALPHLQRGTRDRAVVGQHPHLVLADLLGYWSDAQLELGPVSELEYLSRTGLRETGDVRRKS